MSPSTEPAFKDLPLNKAHPRYAAWGVWGEKDELGTLNRLTADVVAAAANEVQTGERCSLDWRMDLPTYPYFGREVFEQKIKRNAPLTNDDILHFNTQSSSQWDSLRHFGCDLHGSYYNGVHIEDIAGLEEPGLAFPRLITSKTTVNGIQNMAKKGIVGRGVLIDFARYAKLNNITSFGAFKPYGITIAELEACAKAQNNLEIQYGDVLIVRTGHAGEYDALSDEERKQLAKTGQTFAGMLQEPSTLEFIWDKGVSAVAGDTPAWECIPKNPQGKGEPGMSLHHWILSSFGCPMGELFDLEALSELCEKHQRWSFFFTSAPLNVPGGVGSPPNALAIF